MYTPAFRPPYNPMYDYNNMPYDSMQQRPPYNDYLGSRYDIPDVDYPPNYTNDIEGRYYTRNDMMPPSLSTSNGSSRRRIIYYAHLPEVVRR